MITSLVVTISPCLAAEILEFGQNDGTRLSVQRFKASGQNLIILLPTIYALMAWHEDFATTLSGSGVEVWLTDPINGRFMPEINSSYVQLPADDPGAVVKHTRV